MEGELLDWELLHLSDTESTDSITSDKRSLNSSVIDNGMILSDHFSVHNLIKRSGDSSQNGVVESGDSFPLHYGSESPNNPGEVRFDSSSLHLDVYRSGDAGLRNDLGFNDFPCMASVSDTGEKHVQSEAFAELTDGRQLESQSGVEEPIEDSSKSWSNELVSVDSATVNGEEDDIVSDSGVVSTDSVVGSGRYTEEVVGDVNSADESKSREIVWWKMPLVLLKYCAFRIGPVWSVSMAAAVMGLALLGRRLYNMKKNAQRFNLKVTIDDKKAARVMSQAARLNEVFTEMSSGDTTKKSRKTRTAAQRGVGRSSRSAPQVDWPRPEGLRFELPEKLTRQPPKKIAQSADVAMRPFTSTWDEYDNFFYNAMLNLNSEPTRWLEPSFINHLEWFNYLQELKDSLGLGTMPFRRYEFYPELALHFLASCRIRYEPPMDKRACNGQLFFKIDGQAHFLSFAEICETFMFDTDGVELQIPENDAAFQALWRELTNSAIYNSATSTQAEIRLPVLRVFLKLLDSTILCKMESGKMRKSNLLLLHYAIGSRFSYAAPGSEGHKINFGAIFADLLESVKFRGLEVGQKPKTESIGSLITPLLERVGIDLSSRIADTRTNLITEQNLKGKFLSGKWGAIRYSFAYPSGFRDSIRIPSPFCRVDSAEALRFLQLRAGAADPITEDIPSSSSSAPPSLGPFVPPPVGCYEEDPYRSWFVEQMSTFWEYVRGMPRCCCTRDDIIRHPPPGTRPRRSRRAPDEDSDGRLPRSRSNTQPGL